MKTTTLAALILAGLSLLACSSSSAGLPGSSTPGESAVDREARQLAQKHFDVMFTRCGDSYYHRFQVNPAVLKQDQEQKEFWEEIKNPRLEVSASKITDTDKMNGIEWQGVVKIFADNYRSHGQSAGWSKWFPGKELLSARPKKTKGHWEFHGWSGQLSGGTELKLPGDDVPPGAREKTYVLASVDCSKVPK